MLRDQIRTGEIGRVRCLPRCGRLVRAGYAAATMGRDNFGVPLVKLTKVLMRAAAEIALRDRGYEIELVASPGVIPGARLKARKHGVDLQIAVRAASDRELGLVRDGNNRWKTIPRMDAVIAAAPAQGDRHHIEVYWFEAGELLQQFDQELARRLHHKSDFSPKAPIFLPLDDREGERGPRQAGLKHLAKWNALVQAASVAPVNSFVERVKREFAALNGVDVSRVEVKFRILA